MKSAAERPFSIRWKPIMFGRASLRSVLPVPGGPYKTKPLENFIGLLSGFRAN
jgi:hypothetical protein